VRCILCHGQAGSLANSWFWAMAEKSCARPGSCMVGDAWVMFLLLEVDKGDIGWHCWLGGLDRPVCHHQSHHCLLMVLFAGFQCRFP